MDNGTIGVFNCADLIPSDSPGEPLDPQKNGIFCHRRDAHAQCVVSLVYLEKHEGLIVSSGLDKSLKLWHSRPSRSSDIINSCRAVASVALTSKSYALSECWVFLDENTLQFFRDRRSGDELFHLSLDSLCTLKLLDHQRNELAPSRSIGPLSAVYMRFLTDDVLLEAGADADAFLKLVHQILFITSTARHPSDHLMLRRIQSKPLRHHATLFQVWDSVWAISPGDSSLVEWTIVRSADQTGFLGSNQLDLAPVRTFSLALPPLANSAVATCLIQPLSENHFFLALNADLGTVQTGFQTSGSLSVAAAAREENAAPISAVGVVSLFDQQKRISSTHVWTGDVLGVLSVWLLSEKSPRLLRTAALGARSPSILSICQIDDRAVLVSQSKAILVLDSENPEHVLCTVTDPSADAPLDLRSILVLPDPRNAHQLTIISTGVDQCVRIWKLQK